MNDIESLAHMREPLEINASGSQVLTNGGQEGLVMHGRRRGVEGGAAGKGWRGGEVWFGLQMQAGAGPVGRMGLLEQQRCPSALERREAERFARKSSWCLETRGPNSEGEGWRGRGRKRESGGGGERGGK